MRSRVINDSNNDQEEEKTGGMGARVNTSMSSSTNGQLENALETQLNQINVLYLSREDTKKSKRDTFMSGFQNSGGKSTFVRATSMTNKPRASTINNNNQSSLARDHSSGGGTNTNNDIGVDPSLKLQEDDIDEEKDSTNQR